MERFRVKYGSEACLASYLGVWAYEPVRFRSLVEAVRSGKLVARGQENRVLVADMTEALGGWGEAGTTETRRARSEECWGEDEREEELGPEPLGGWEDGKKDGRTECGPTSGQTSGQTRTTRDSPARRGAALGQSLEEERRRDAQRAGWDELTEEGIAVIGVRGTLMKGVSKFDPESSSTVGIRRALRAAARSADVAGVLLVIDSPGGTVAGTQELGDDISKLASMKPVWAQIEDLGASAAYWAASQAGKVFANRTAMVGSIGTYAVIEDWSRMYEEVGVTVHVLSTGEFKGLGVPGTEVTDAQLEKVQEEVEALNGHFLEAIRKGRGMSLGAVKKLATGEVWIAEKAREVGLIDGVQGRDETLEGMAGALKALDRERRARAKGKVRAAQVGRLEAE